MKIKKLILHNYRSYKHEEIEFSEGFNVLTGSGGNGKSNITRAINVVTKNDNSGSSIGEYILDDKQKIKKDKSCYVEIHTYDNHIVRRERTRSDNFYVIDNGEPIRNFGQGVPDEVSAIFNIGEINIQSQFETHFLLHDKSSDVAKTLNKVVDLEIIDESIANAGKIVRAIKKEKDASDNNIKKYEEEVGKYSFLEKMEEDVNTLISLEEKREKAKTDIDNITAIKDDITAIKEEINKVSASTDMLPKVEKLLSLYSEKEILEKEGGEINDLASNIRKVKTQLKDVETTVSFSERVDKLIEVMDNTFKLTKEYNSMFDTIEEIERVEAELGDCGKTIQFKDRVDSLLQMYHDKMAVNDNMDWIRSLIEEIKEAEKEIRVLDESIKENSDKIIGSVCPFCGNEIKDLKEVC